MIKNLRVNKKLWLITALLALAVSLIGVINQNIYSEVISQEILPGVVSQDLITVIISIVLIFLSLKVEAENIKSQILTLSFLAYIFYAYGIYAIEQIYNSFYILYLLIFSLSFWSIIFSLSNYDKSVFKKINLNKYIKYLTLSFLIIIPLLFYFLWINQLLPLMRTGEKIEFAFSVYILDIVFILPALIITAILIIKDKSLGYISAPILFFKAFTLLFSVGLGAAFRVFYELSFNPEESFFYIILSLLFLALAVLNILKLKISIKD